MVVLLVVLISMLMSMSTVRDWAEVRVVVGSDILLLYMVMSMLVVWNGIE